MSALALLLVAGLVVVGSAVLALALGALMAVNGRTDRRVVLGGALARDVDSAAPGVLAAFARTDPAAPARTDQPATAVTVGPPSTTAG